MFGNVFLGLDKIFAFQNEVGVFFFMFYVKFIDIMCEISNPLRGLTGWHFAQAVYLGGVVRAQKSSEGSGNIPKVIIIKTKNMAEYSEIELKPDSSVTPLGNCRYDIDGRTIEFAIRKLTVRECYRLMDVPENVIDKLLSCDENGKQIISNSQGYKLAGNSIVVSCLYHLFEQIWYPKEQQPTFPKQLTLF